MNLYSLPPGDYLDKLIRERLFGKAVDGKSCPAYSTEESAADRVKARLKSKYGTIICGHTRIRGKSWFARYGTDPSTSLEVIAETYPLVICRLAVLITANDSYDRD